MPVMICISVCMLLSLKDYATGEILTSPQANTDVTMPREHGAISVTSSRTIFPGTGDITVTSSSERAPPMNFSKLPLASEDLITDTSEITTQTGNKFDRSVIISLILEGNYETSVSLREDEFKEHLIKQLAISLNISPTRMNLEIKAGSIVVTCTIQSEAVGSNEISSVEAAMQLMKQVNAQSLALSGIDNEPLTVVPGSFMIKYEGDICDNNPCHNDGICGYSQTLPLNFKCSCRFGSSGTLCQHSFFALMTSLCGVAMVLSVITLMFVWGTWSCCSPKMEDYKKMEEDELPLSVIKTKSAEP